MSPIDFYFDLTSPYSYLASHWIEPLAAKHGRRVEWHAILLGATFQAAELKSPMSYPIKREYSLHDFERSARYEGVPFAMPETFPVPTQNVSRVFWWLKERPDAGDPASASAWARRCFTALFVQGRNPAEANTLAELAREHGISADEAQAVCADTVWKTRLREANEAAIAAGVFGAPTFIVDGERFWGNDRQAQLARWLEAPF